MIEQDVFAGTILAWTEQDVKGKPVTGTPVGLHCPGCGEPPVMAFGGTQAWCGTDDCPFLTWDPTKTLAELNADAKQIDLSGERDD